MGINYAICVRKQKSTLVAQVMYDILSIKRIILIETLSHWKSMDP